MKYQNKIFKNIKISAKEKVVEFKKKKKKNLLTWHWRIDMDDKVGSAASPNWTSSSYQHTCLEKSDIMHCLQILAP